jgi:hypothetical protein
VFEVQGEGTFTLYVDKDVVGHLTYAADQPAANTFAWRDATAGEHVCSFEDGSGKRFSCCVTIDPDKEATTFVRLRGPKAEKKDPAAAAGAKPQ